MKSQPEALASREVKSSIPAPELPPIPAGQASLTTAAALFDLLDAVARLDAKAQASVLEAVTRLESVAMFVANALDERS